MKFLHPLFFMSEKAVEGKVRQRENDDGNAAYPLYGLDAEIHAKIQSKYNAEQEAEVLQWISVVLHTPSPLSFSQLRDGSLLCRLANVIAPGTIPSYTETPRHRLEAQENILAYLRGCRKLGVREQDLFQVKDLLDDVMRYQVLVNVYALAREAQVIELPSFLFGENKEY